MISQIYSRALLVLSTVVKGSMNLHLMVQVISTREVKLHLLASDS